MSRRAMKKAKRSAAFKEKVDLFKEEGGSMMHTTAGYALFYNGAVANGKLLLADAFITQTLAEQVKLEKMKPGPGRARHVHKLVDEVLTREEIPHRPISCRKGCNACCHMYVTATRDEAELLLEKNILIDCERLEKQATMSPEDFEKAPKEIRRCVFLGDDGLCKVYDDRPSACRTYAVVSDPLLCDLDLNKQEKKVHTAVTPKAEIFATAAMNACHPPNNSELISLPEQLLAAIRRKENT